MDHDARPARNNAEFSGRTLEDALEAASDALGLPISALQYEVMRDSTRSFLGFVRTGEVTVRVSWEDVPAGRQQPPAPRQAAREPVAPVTEEVYEPEVAEDELETEPEPEPEEVLEPERGPVAVAARVPDEDEEHERPAGPDGNPAGMEDVALDVLTTLLDKMGALAAVEVVEHGGGVDESGEVAPLILNVIGDDLGVLIGRRGEALRSLQFMTRLIASRRLGVWPNLVVDVESYKAKREESLRSLALRVASQVRESRQPMALEPMPAHERRIVHLTLRDDPDVYTESTGKEDHRKVQILPR
jgi:spoIIIJ-associated protein